MEMDIEMEDIQRREECISIVITGLVFSLYIVYWKRRAGVGWNFSFRKGAGGVGW